MAEVGGQDEEALDPRDGEGGDDDRGDHAPDLAQEAGYEHQRHEGDDVGQDREADRDGDTPSTGDGRRVLFLDDEADIRTVVKHALESHGFEVYCAKTGEEAIEVYNKADDFGKPFDLALFDLQIRGGLGGVATLTKLREDYPKIRAVVTSGYVDDTVLSNHLEHGFLGVLAKPFRIDQLISVVSELATNGKSV